MCVDRRDMIGIKIHERIHRELKIEAAKTRTTVPDMASRLIELAIDAVRDGRLSLDEKPKSTDER